MKRSPFDLLTDLLEDKVAPEKISLAVKGLFLFVVCFGLLAAFTAPDVTSRESIFHKTVSDFVEQPDIKAGQIDLYKLKVYLYSLPFRAGSRLGETGQTTLMRLFGLVFLVLTLVLVYQTAKRVWPRHHFVPLLVLTLLTTNNKLMTSAVTIGGDAFTFFFFAFLLYELVEIAGRGAFFDVGLALVLVFILSKIDIALAQNVALPLLFFVLGATIIAVYQEELTRLLPGSHRTRLAIGGVFVAVFVAAQKVKLLALAVAAPTSLFVSLAHLGAWPAVIRQLVTFFGAAPGLVEGFGWAQRGLFVLFEVLALTALVGLVRLAYMTIAERVQTVETATAPMGGGRRVIFVKPKTSTLEGVNLPALLTIAVLPMTVFAANNTYALGGLLSDSGVYMLTVPLTLLVGAGLKEALALKSVTKPVIGLVAAVLTINVASLLLSVLWR